jgi:hypothetical protein
MSDFALMDTYPNSIQELGSVERNINDSLSEMQKSIDIGASTFTTEEKARKGLDNMMTIITKLETEYLKYNTAKNALPEREYSRRINEIQSWKTSHGRLKGKYEGLISSKYGYV